MHRTMHVLDAPVPYKWSLVGYALNRNKVREYDMSRIRHRSPNRGLLSGRGGHTPLSAHKDIHDVVLGNVTIAMNRAFLLIFLSHAPAVVKFTTLLEDITRERKQQRR